MNKLIKIILASLLFVMITTFSTAQQSLWGANCDSGQSLWGTACSGSGGGGGTPTPGRAIIYGDSTSDSGNPTNCEWCAPLITYGFQIMATARGGARSYDNVVPTQANACASTASGSLYGDYVGCGFFGERSIKHFEGACRRVLPGTQNVSDGSGGYNVIADTSTSTAYPGDTTNLSCLVNLPHAQKDVVVLGYGTNDIGTLDAAGWAAIKPTSLLAWNVMLDTIEDRRLACVVVLGVPYYGATNASTSDDSLQDLHASLRAEVSANRPLCVVAEVHSAISAYEQTLGVADYIELFQEGTASPPTCAVNGSGFIQGCVHLIAGTSAAGINPTQVMGDIILTAVQQAVLLKSASL